MVAPSPPEKQQRNAPAPRGNKSKSGSGDNSSSNSNNNNSENRDETLQSISRHQSALLQPVVTMTIYVPTSSVGAVIGRRGQNIAHLQKIAATAGSGGGGSSSSNNSNNNQAVRVSVVGQDSTDSVPYTYSELDWSDSQWTPVVIRADPVACLVAAAKIQGMVPANAVDDVVLDLPVSRNLHASVVGKKGMTLAGISADYAVRIMVPSKELRHDIIQCEGELNNVKQCLERLLQVLFKAAKARAHSNADKNNSNNRNNPKDVPDEPATAVVTFRVHQVPSQTKLRSIARKVDCQIKKRKVDDSTWHVQVTAPTQELVSQAVAILQKWTEDQQQQQQSSNATTPNSNSSADGGNNNSKNNNNNNNNGDGGGSQAASSSSRRNNNVYRGRSAAGRNQQKRKKDQGSSSNNSSSNNNKSTGGGGGGSSSSAAAAAPAQQQS